MSGYSRPPTLGVLFFPQGAPACSPKAPGGLLFPHVSHLEVDVAGPKKKAFISSFELLVTVLVADTMGQTHPIY